MRCKQSSWMNQMEHENNKRRKLFWHKLNKRKCSRWKSCDSLSWGWRWRCWKHVQTVGLWFARNKCEYTWHSYKAWIHSYMVKFLATCARRIDKSSALGWDTFQELRRNLDKCGIGYIIIYTLYIQLYVWIYREYMWKQEWADQRILFFVLKTREFFTFPIF